MRLNIYKLENQQFNIVWSLKSKWAVTEMFSYLVLLIIFDFVDKAVKAGCELVLSELNKVINLPVTGGNNWRLADVVSLPIRPEIFITMEIVRQYGIDVCVWA